MGEDFLYASGSSSGVLRILLVYSWLYWVQSTTGRSAAPALNTPGLRNSAMKVMKPP